MSSSDWQASLVERQSVLQQQQLWRTRQESLSAQSAVIKCHDGEMVNFSSNDYLGLASHPQLITAMQDSAACWGVGSGASHMVTGHQAPHHAFEQAVADFIGAESALLFSTGYMANLAVQTALLGRSDIVLQDKLSHASLIDGAQLSAAKLKRYRHGDTAHAEALLKEGIAEQKSLIVTDGVFSMDGDIAPLTELKALVDRYNSVLYVDDAHGLGVLGNHGGGSLELANMQPQGNVLLLGTLGKAFGSFGAFVAGDRVFIEQLIQSARSYIYTTALPSPVVAASHAALVVIQEQGQVLRDHLNHLLAKFKQGASQLGLPLMPSETPIQPIVFGATSAALCASGILRQQGFLVAAIRPPTVPKGSARLRITFSAAHTVTQVEQLLDCLASQPIQALISKSKALQVNGCSND